MIKSGSSADLIYNLDLWGTWSFKKIVAFNLGGACSCKTHCKSCYVVVLCCYIVLGGC